MDRETAELLEAARAKLIAYRTGRAADGKPHALRSLRQLARELDMSPSGVGKLLEGTTPYAPTVRALIGWYKAQTPHLRAEALGEALESLARLYPPASRAAVVEAFGDVARRLDSMYSP